MTKTPRQNAVNGDIEFGRPKLGSEDDNSKNKKPVFLVRCKQYTRAFYAIGLVFSILFLLYLVIIYLGSKQVTTLSFQEGWDSNSENGSRESLSTLAKTFKLMIVADLDKASRVKDDKKGKWRSILKKAELRRGDDGTFTVHWLEDQEIFTKFSEAGRGMELSALLNYHNHLYTFDDRTGLAFELVKGNRAIPRFIMMEGNGNTDKGQKTEWATVKDDMMIVGSFGKEYTRSDGSIANTNNMWVSKIDANGAITHEDWTARFNKLRKAANVEFPGYMIHEAIVWSDILKRWVILPRRVSKEPYDDVKDERRGSNLVLIATENFGKVEVRRITPLTPTRGFSEFKFLPGSNDRIIVALKSEENEENQTQNTFITVFSLDGEILMEETPIPGQHKFEGLEFFYF